MSRKTPGETVDLRDHAAALVRRAREFDLLTGWPTTISTRPASDERRSSRNFETLLIKVRRRNNPVERTSIYSEAECLASPEFAKANARVSLSIIAARFLNVRPTRNSDCVQLLASVVGGRPLSRVAGLRTRGRPEVEIACRNFIHQPNQTQLPRSRNQRIRLAVKPAEVIQRAKSTPGVSRLRQRLRLLRFQEITRTLIDRKRYDQGHTSSQESLEDSVPSAMVAFFQGYSSSRNDRCADVSAANLFQQPRKLRGHQSCDSGMGSCAPPRNASE